MSKKNTPASVEKDLQKLFKKYQITDELTVEEVKEWVYHSDINQKKIQQYLEKCLSYFPEVADSNELNKILPVFTAAWNVFPHKALGGKFPDEMKASQNSGSDMPVIIEAMSGFFDADFEDIYGEHFMNTDEVDRIRDGIFQMENEDRGESQNSMQEVLRKCWKWLGKNEEKYSETINYAIDTFWGERSDLAPIVRDSDTEAFFNEFLLLDHSTEGFIFPASLRENLLSEFLNKEKKQLSKGALYFGQQMSESYRSFYQIEDVVSGMYVEMKDLILEKNFQVWDVNMSKNLEKGDIVYTRIAENEHGKYIGAGKDFIPVSQKFMEFITPLIEGTFLMTINQGEEMTMPEYLKWNGYIIYRELNHALRLGFYKDKAPVGRNEPCPCQSGKKYKKCCGR